MSASPYAIPEDEFLDSARVPVAEQVAEHPDRRLSGDTGGGSPIVGEGHGVDGDGE